MGQNFPSFLAIAALAAAFSQSCSKKDDDEGGKVKIQPQLLRIEATNYAGLHGQQALKINNLGYTKTSNVTIKSLKYPIGSISLADSGNNGMPIYECGGASNDECLVELTGDALTNLLANAPVREARTGTYTQVNLSPCYQTGTSSDVRVKLTAEATIDGVPYFTNSSTGLSASGPAEEVTFAPNGGCGTIRFLTKDIIISKDSFVEKERTVEGEGATSGELKTQIDLKLYFDLANAVIAAGPSTATNAADAGSDGDFCKGAGTQEDAYICINFPEIVATVDSGTPSLTRMLINDSTIWGFYSNSDGVPFGAYQRSYYNGFYSADPEFLVGPMFERFQVNADGTVTFQQFDDGQNRHIKVSNFKLEDHSGTMTKGTATLNYTAVKLP